jgi:hypothetical protein
MNPQEFYLRNFLYPMLYGTRPLVTSIVKMKMNIPPLPSSPLPSSSLPSSPLPSSPPPPIMYRSFFRNSNNPPLSHLEKRIVHSSTLRSEVTIDYYKKKGLQWLKRVETKSYPQILRNPTMGCTVELTSKPTLYTVHIDSKEAKKIIARECYF